MGWDLGSGSGLINYVYLIRFDSIFDWGMEWELGYWYMMLHAAQYDF